MRAGLIASAIGHVAALMLGLIALANPNLFPTVPTNSIAVDMVSPKDMPRPTTEPPKLDLPLRQPVDQANSQTAPAPAPPAPPVTQPPQSGQIAINPTAITAPLYLPTLVPNGNGSSVSFSAPAVTASLAQDERAAFLAQVQKCWTAPAGIAERDKLRAVLRVSLKPDGALMAEPMLIQASASQFGPALVESAKRALRECQPFTALPADKYDQWRLLDLTFSPTGVSGG